MAGTEEVMELDSLDDACRLCLDTKRTRSSIFDGLANAEVPFAEKIRTHLSIQVSSEDKVSTSVCSICVQNVNQWHSFRETCLKSQERLQKWVEKKEAIKLPKIMAEKESVPAEKVQHEPQVKPNESSNVVQQTSEDNQMEVDTETSITSVPTECNTTLLSQSSISNVALDSTNEQTVQVKDEPMDSEEEYDFNVDVESVASEHGELLPNPMAMRTANPTTAERVVEADSTQKPVQKTFKVRRKIRRGPKTHFRGLKSFKKKCITCGINLHSKWSYQQHMAKYHTYENGVSEGTEQPSVEPVPAQPAERPVSQPPSDQPPEVHGRTILSGEFTPNRQRTKITPYDFNALDGTETCFPEERVYSNMIKTEPLTPLQRVLIGQLKTFSCFQCQHSYSNRKMTLNHIRLHMPELKNFTCLACFSEFPDRSMYKRHCAASFECAMKIALVVPKKGVEKYFTCNMCLRPYGGRKEVMQHIADHSAKQMRQMEAAAAKTPDLVPLKSPSRVSLRSPGRPPLRSPPELTPIKSIPLATPPPVEPKTYSPLKGQSFSVFNGPYQNGDPAHNFACDLCGMIYRYRPNLLKHREVCETLPLHDRTSYRCIHCNMTYLIYKKFLSHIFTEHKKHEITCFTCQSKFLSSEDYFNHHESHRIGMNKATPVKEMKENEELKIQPKYNHAASPDPAKVSADLQERLEKPFKCALCSEMFASKAELSEHRNLHLKVKIYSCVICRSMFSSSVSLEQHMKMHGIDNGDSNEQNAANNSCVELGNSTHSQSMLNDSAMSATSEPGVALNLQCMECQRVFSNLPNLKRHQKNVHLNKDRRRWTCDKCNRRFKTEESYHEHLRLGHGIFQPQPAKVAPVPLVTPRYDDKPPLKCPKCPKTFTYQGNLIIHCQNVHKENHFERAKLNASRQLSSTPIPSAAIAPTVISPPITSPQDNTCDVCGKSFSEAQSLRVHRGWHFRSTHKLKTETSTDDFETHDEEMPSAEKQNNFVVQDRGYTTVTTPLIPIETPPPAPKPAKARKSFPNNPPRQQLDVLAASSSIGSLQCQVCDDRFSDVTELRKHLWDVHCARNKPDREDPLREEDERPPPQQQQQQLRKQYQCGICPSKFQEEDSLRAHSRWHEQNLISSSNGPSSQAAAVDEIRSVSDQSTTGTGQFHCDICGKSYTNRKVFYRHKKLHKVMPGTAFSFQSLQARQSHYCKVCRKNFATEASLRRHKRSEIHAIVVKEQAEAAAAPQRITTTALVHHPPPEQPRQLQPQLVRQPVVPQPMLVVKKEPAWDDQSYHQEPQQSSYASASSPVRQLQNLPEVTFRRKAFRCQICQTLFPNMSVLYQHKQLVHKMPPINKKPPPNNKCVPLMNAAGMVCCNLCGKQFPGIPNLKQHFTLKHKNATMETFPCNAADCNLVFTSAAAMKAHEVTHSNIIFTCHLCDRHVFSRGAMTKHQLTAHHAVYMSGVNRASLWSEFDLNAYSVRNCQGTECLSCKIKYPNLRALKIHFIKIHDRI